MNTISNVLFWISTGLLVPVIVLLIFFFIRSLITVGAFFGEYVTMRKTTNRVYNQLDNLTLDNYSELIPKKCVLGAYAHKIMTANGNEAIIDRILAEYEIEADKRTSTLKIFTKMGPILGLMGTLIPMGPALVGLAAGDIGSMAYNMQVAFATTVVGLTVSAIGLCTQLAKDRWAAKEYTILEYLANLVQPSTNNTKA